MKIDDKIREILTGEVKDIIRESFYEAAQYTLRDIQKHTRPSRETILMIERLKKEIEAIKTNNTKIFILGLVFGILISSIVALSI